MENLEETVQSEFEKDLAIISEAEKIETETDRIRLVALILGLSFTFLIAFTIFNGINLLGLKNQFTDVYLFIFREYLLVIIVWFFAFLALFIGKKYLLSIFTIIGLGLFLFVMSWINF